MAPPLGGGVGTTCFGLGMMLINILWKIDSDDGSLLCDEGVIMVAMGRQVGVVIMLLSSRR